MCCFSRPVERVGRTRIFARPTHAGRQVVVYQMEFSAAEELAMILPLPVALGIPVTEFRFIDFVAYPEFFSDLTTGFPAWPLPAPAAISKENPSPGSTSRLKVVSVGHFEASFVPRLEDFGRLDPRFRIQPSIWKQLPGYDRMGFAVFQLKPGPQRVHPMAFAFPRKDSSTLFFPTLHIHDSQVHPQEEFDHELYAQGNHQQSPEVMEWEESRGWASNFVKTSRTAGVLHNDAHVYRRRIVGRQLNQDTYLRLNPA